MTDAKHWDELPADLGALTGLISRVRRDREGVAMFLVLEDLADDASANPTGPEANPQPLADIVQRYLNRLRADGADPGEDEVAVLLEALAATDFRGAAQ